MRFFVTIFTLVIAFTAAPTFAQSTQDPAYDTFGGKVMDRQGDCVRTRWTDENDECAPPPAPAPAPRVEPAPRPVIAREARTVYFAFDKAELDSEAKAKLQNLADIVRRSKAIERAVILGYADEIGNADYNLELSERRASAALEYLDKYVDIPLSVRTVQGKGETDSVTDCENIANRDKKIACLAGDRRVEVKFIYHK
jgi:outer membrane protein OmpA-like peptidoglycan-associated protein